MLLIKLESFTLITYLPLCQRNASNHTHTISAAWPGRSQSGNTDTNNLNEECLN